ncbi:MAG: hypothetical protein ACPL3C_03370 [Pyrobaculum sp.]
MREKVLGLFESRGYRIEVDFRTEYVDKRGHLKYIWPPISSLPTLFWGSPGESDESSIFIRGFGWYRADVEELGGSGFVGFSGEYRRDMYSFEIGLTQYRKKRVVPAIILRLPKLLVF